MSSPIGVGTTHCASCHRGDTKTEMRKCGPYELKVCINAGECVRAAEKAGIWREGV